MYKCYIKQECKNIKINIDDYKYNNYKNFINQVKLIIKNLIQKNINKHFLVEEMYKN